MTSTEPHHTKRFAVATLGCKVNQFETADMVEQLKADGWQLVPFTAEADLYLINSCTVTARSDAESRRLIRRARRANPLARVVATGCYAQVAPSDLQALPELNLVLGNEEKHDLVLHMERGEHRVTDLTSLKTSGPLRLTSFSEHTRAFLQIQNGCETGCSYCIVPIARGPSRSVPPQEVTEAVSRLVGSGYQEVVLTGIHMGAYGLDLSPCSSLTELVLLLEKQNAIHRLRLGSIEPNELTDGLLALFKHSTRLCHHLHIPLQSGSDSVLQRMGRGYDTNFYANRITTAAQLLPDAFIAADLIAGFPGETEQEFSETCTFVASLPLADLHLFPYSIRPGTKAAAMSGHLKPAIIKERAERLRGIAADKRAAFQQRFIGKPLPVLGQRHNPVTGLMTGLSRNYLEVCYPAPPSLLNHEVTVHVDYLHSNYLHGICEGV
ncbi:tRNA (N(6)-L-threonylcarbamoyladenosine(37)-C(2))-methylthiotransferase MtaB [Trichlorobacter lovleyi]|uniref:tRNA (N(6)-L-threonylcarbamoyladenosine(37)-C(2))- methylthiotransferase MtaB n=1 Tax=Trichlorobacter lovleyi TaxID=313985 RepID=UPI00223EED25|nr:tRNA (N(6)-L-threonylcarbamoyladenosine(37)-C(2))-methylthiotransferase MtaB [Trichlorobacter lovleyi]QOX79268.1 tRNA (N(6)-L-threonylcarbamoyladenosine(37)-C(2))-methylthiotransferase MtaB [Trichlorobacter lovleyi]